MGGISTQYFFRKNNLFKGFNLNIILNYFLEFLPRSDRQINSIRLLNEDVTG